MDTLEQEHYETMMGLGEPYEEHVLAAGVTEGGLAEWMVLLTAYLGQPAASVAMATVLGTAPRPAAVAAD